MIADVLRSPKADREVSLGEKIEMYRSLRKQNDSYCVEALRCCLMEIVRRNVIQKGLGSLDDVDLPTEIREVLALVSESCDRPELPGR